MTLDCPERISVSPQKIEWRTVAARTEFKEIQRLGWQTTSQNTSDLLSANDRLKNIRLLLTDSSSETGIEIAPLITPDLSLPLQDNESSGQETLSLNKQLQTLFAEGEDEVFEDGVESRFVANFIAFIQTQGGQGLNTFESLLASFPDEPTGRALRWLGQIDQPETKETRRQLLEKQLTHSSIHVRNGALLGLVAMRENKSISIIQNALGAEKLPAFKRVLSNAIEFLSRT